ncbi:MAG: anti-sigma factor [Anaerolineaceae bacterium]
MSHYPDQIPLYAAGQLDAAESAKLEKHLAVCPECRKALRFWQELRQGIQAESAQLAAPPALAQRALRQIHASRQASSAGVGRRLALAFLRTCSLLRAQAYMVKREIWPASAGVMFLGVCMALLSNHAEAVSFLAPLVAAACMASLFGPENDPAHELTQSTPTSSWKILLARLSLVSGYTLLLSLLIIPPVTLGMIILAWLAPLALLSSLALLLSVWVGTGSAVVVSYLLWLVQYVKVSDLIIAQVHAPALEHFFSAYRTLFQSPGLQMILAAVLLAAALISAASTGRGLGQTAS